MSPVTCGWRVCRRCLCPCTLASMCCSFRVTSISPTLGLDEDDELTELQVDKVAPAASQCWSCPPSDALPPQSVQAVVTARAQECMPQSVCAPHRGPHRTPCARGGKLFSCSQPRLCRTVVQALTSPRLSSFVPVCEGGERSISPSTSIISFAKGYADAQLR